MMFCLLKRGAIFAVVIWFIFSGMAVLASTVRSSSTNFILWADVFSSGGDEAGTSTNFKVQDTIGESIIYSSTSTSSNFGTKAGFRELEPNEFLTFTVSTTSIDLGTQGTATTTKDSHTMNVETNAGAGFRITVTGTTLTSGANTISAIGTTAAASAVGTEQFGINFVDNATPDVGADPSGTVPIGAAADQYKIADSFAYSSGDVIASSTAAINDTTLTASYITNIAAGTDAGDYSTTLTYAATVNP